MSGNLHSSPPQVGEVMLETHLYGGPCDGDSIDSPYLASAAEIPVEDRTEHYLYSVYASAHFARHTFIHSSLPWDIFAP